MVNERHKKKHLLEVEIIVNVPDVVDIAVPRIDVEDADDVDDVAFDNVEFDDVVGGAVATGAPLYEVGAGGPVSTAGSAR
jgi:hypothetical protein